MSSHRAQCTLTREEHNTTWLDEYQTSAILLTVVALVLVSVMWTENYGEEKKDENTSSTWSVLEQHK